MLFFGTAHPASAQKKLAIVGSSTSACYGASVFDSCYVGRLYNYFNKQEPRDTVVNNGFAVPGYTCYKGMPSSYVSPYANLQPDPAHNITAALATHPNVVLVNYPTNGYDSLRIDSIMYCLRTIRDSANKAGVPCFITTTQPRSSAPLFNHSAVKLKLAILKDSILAEFGNFAIDFYTGLYNPADSSILYDAGDQTHMNNIGHDSLFQRVRAKNIFLAILPATFLKFNAVYKNKTNTITWLTAQETEVAYYEIQRSGDGTNFSKIARVNANNSNGNNQYQYTDGQVLKGWNYYTILIVDKDGKKQTSPVMSVYINTGKLAIVRAFARSASQVVVELQNNDPQQTELQILSNMGMLISKTSRKIEAGNTILYLDTPLLSNGIYHIKLTTAKESVVGSFIKN
ncbi:MAG: hypothetical protein NVSMB7_09340 [Chitinophagaceae bacterium]